MHYQDYVFSAGSICFSLALLPMVFGKIKPAFSSAAMTAFWLWIFAAMYATLGLTFSMITGSSTAFLWTVLAIQARINGRYSNRSTR